MNRFLLKYLTDLILWAVAVPLSFWVRLEGARLEATRYAPLIPIYTILSVLVKAAAIYGFGLHRQSWRRVGVRDLFRLIWAVGVVSVLTFGVVLVVSDGPPRSIPLLEGLLALVMMGGVRLLNRLWRERQQGGRSAGRAKRVLVVGAGETGTMVTREMLRHPEAGMAPVGFLDDDPVKQRQRLMGVPVLGSIDDLPDVVAGYRVGEVLVAMPSAPGSVVRHVVEMARFAGVSCRTLPSFNDIISGQVSISQIRDVDVEDLLRRAPVELDLEKITGYLAGRVVLVTGAGGSIGSELVRQVAYFAPASLVLVGHGENSLFRIEHELARRWPDQPHDTVIADIQDREKLAHLFEVYRPQVVFHAAAHKHVPLMELNPDAAIFNNVGGTRNMVELALRFGVERFVNISTDKAVNPTSVMGASKRVAEYVVQRAGRQAAPGQALLSVRFGNVLGSRGSVVPLFKAQIKRGGPVTVTHPEMTRYFMTIPEAAQLVIEAGGIGENGRVYVLDMGEPVRIVDLAHDLIQLSGLEPGEDVEIVFTGVRPGEKLYEELLTAEEKTEPSTHEKIFIARASAPPDDDLLPRLDALFEAAVRRDSAAIIVSLRALLPTYRPVGRG